MIEIHEIYKIPVYAVLLDLDLEEIKNACLKNENKNKGRVVSNRGGYQSYDMDLKQKEFAPLIEKIEEHATNFAKPLVNTKQQKLDNMWINVNGYKDTNTSHNHPDADISGVFYVQTPKQSGEIVFEHPAKDVLSYYNCGQNVERWNTYNSSCTSMGIAPNLMYLFPSWLNHLVEANLNEKNKRISISFNTKQIKK